MSRQQRLKENLRLAQEKAGLWPAGMTTIEELAWDAQGEWANVAMEHAPKWTHGYKRILAEISDIKQRRSEIEYVPRKEQN